MRRRLATGSASVRCRRRAGEYEWPGWTLRSVTTASGTALVTAVVQWARATGYRYLRLHIGNENPAAVRLYAGIGSKPPGPQ